MNEPLQPIHKLVPTKAEASAEDAFKREREAYDDALGKKSIAAWEKWVHGFPPELEAQLRADSLARQAFYHGYMIAAGAWEKQE